MTRNTKKSMWVLLIVFIAAWLLSPVPQTMGETWKATYFVHCTKVEGIPIPDAEGHILGLFVREGVGIHDNGELAWGKMITIGDMTRGVGSFSQYGTATYQDGSTITTYTKGTSGGLTVQFSGEIIHGTGRFQGIKGTVTATGKNLPAEKGEMIPKSLVEVTTTFTLPSK
jgi:hypothetical protein